MDDLISRREAIDAIHGALIDGLSEGTAIEILEELPSAQPVDDWNEIMVICDNCGHAINVKRENCKVSAQPLVKDSPSLVKDLVKVSAQPEIIRCKDCLHNYGLRNNCEFNPEDIVCDYWSTDGLMADDYCSYGERRTDD